MTKQDFPPIHPGEILLEDFLKPMQLSQYYLAQAIGVPPRRINEIVHGKRGITADTALRLGRFFGMEAQFWMNLQTRYDLETTREALADRLDQEVHVHVAYNTIQEHGTGAVAKPNKRWRHYAPASSAMDGRCTRPFSKYA